MLQAYTLADVAAVAGSHITTSIVNAWANKDIIVPDIEGSAGRGRHRQFSFQNLIEARVLGELHKLGLPPDSLRAATIVFRSFPLGFSEKDLDMPLQQGLEQAASEAFGTWCRLLSPKERKVTDQAVLLGSPDVPGGFKVHVSWGRKDFRLSTKGRDQLGAAWIVINLRRVILQVEESTGDNYYDAMVPPGYEDTFARARKLIADRPKKSK
jgi:hypothetical protein